MSEVIIDGQAATTRGISATGSSSDTASLKSIFARSPIHADTYGDEEAKTIMLNTLEGAMVVPGLGTVNLSYAGDNVGPLPDLRNVTVGAGGLPASSFVPNPASSHSGNAADQPAPPEGFGATPTSDGYGDGPTANASERNPIVTARTVKVNSLKYFRA